MISFKTLLLLIFIFIYNIAHGESTCDSVTVLTSNQKTYHSIASLGLYDIVKSGFQLSSACPTENDNQISFCYNGNYVLHKYILKSKDDRSHGLNGVCDSTTTTTLYSPYAEQGSGDTETIIDGIRFKMFIQGTKLCVNAWIPPIGYVPIACKSTEAGYSIVDVCPIMESCSDFTVFKSFFPISAYAIKCSRDGIKRIFYSDQSCLGHTSYLASFQNHFRSVIFNAIVIYIAFAGLKVAIADEPPRYGEVFMHLLKIVLVIYFSVGFPANIGNSSSNNNYNRTVEYVSGLDYLYDFIIDMGFSFQNMIYMASTDLNHKDDFFTDPSTGITTATGYKSEQVALCSFTSNLYLPEYEYLAFFDSLDCRIFQYIAIGVSNIASSGVETVILTWFTGYLGTAIMLMISILNGELLFFIFLILFILLLLGSILYMVSLYIISMFLVAMLILVGPLFVPMMLFEYTKEYYESWKNILIAYALQPLIFGAYMTINFMTMDSIMYRGCVFDAHENTSLFSSGKTAADPRFYKGRKVETSDRSFFAFSINDSASTSDCKKSIGYFMSKTKISDMFDAKTFLIKIYAIKAGLSSYTPDIIQLLVFLFLFYYVSKSIADMAADLSGIVQGPNRMANNIKPTQFVDKQFAAAGKKIGAGYAQMRSTLDKHKGKGLISNIARNGLLQGIGMSMADSAMAFAKAAVHGIDDMKKAVQKGLENAAPVRFMKELTGHGETDKPKPGDENTNPKEEEKSKPDDDTPV